jgi:uncharacterized repeat protein (TIGR03803 family)
MRYDPRYPKKEQMYHPAEESPMRMTSRFVGAILFGVLIFAATALTCAQTFQVIHTFHDADGATPLAGLTLDAAGNLYGTTVHGGNNELGVVFKLSRSGSSWVITPLYKFTGGSDGYNPASRVIFGPDGPLYGSAYEGGAGGWGTVFRLQPSPTRPRTALNTWNETTLYAFQGGGDGAIPWFDLVFRPGGSIYGTTTEGGQGSCGGNGCGTVYQLTGSGNNWTRNLLYAFAGDDDGGFPQGIIFDSAGTSSVRRISVVVPRTTVRCLNCRRQALAGRRILSIASRRETTVPIHCQASSWIAQPISMAAARVLAKTAAVRSSS